LRRRKRGWLQQRFSKIFRKVEETLKIFYGPGSLFIGAGGSFRKPPRFDRCEISGGRMSTPTFRGWCFLPELKRVPWNKIVGVDPLPRGASVGELGKILSPSKCWTTEIQETCLWNNYRKKVHIMSLNKFSMVHEFLNKHENNGRSRPFVFEHSICFRMCDSCGTLESGNCRIQY
jgi:hypothetical protein